MLDITAIGEICALYRGAKDKREQIDILTQLYAVSDREIRQILTDNGYVLPSGASKPAPPPQGSTETKEGEPPKRGRTSMPGKAELANMVAQGLTVAQMAELLGVTDKKIYYHLAKHEIKTNRPPRQANAPPKPKAPPAPKTKAEPVPKAKPEPKAPPVPLPAAPAPAPRQSYKNWLELHQAIVSMSRYAKDARGAVIDGNMGLAGVRAERMCAQLLELERLSLGFKPDYEGMSPCTK